MFARLVVLITDAAVLTCLVVIFGQDRLRRFSHTVLVSLGLACTWFACDLLLRWLTGYLIVLLSLTILTGVALMVLCRLRLKRAVLAAGLFLLLHVVLGTIIQWLG